MKLFWRYKKDGKWNWRPAKVTQIWKDRDVYLLEKEEEE